MSRKKTRTKSSESRALVVAGPPPNAKRAPARRAMVPAGFIDDAAATMGLTLDQLSEITGLATAKALYVWRKQGMAPLWYRCAVNGVMAEFKVGIVFLVRVSEDKAKFARDLFTNMRGAEIMYQSKNVA